MTPRQRHMMTPSPFFFPPEIATYLPTATMHTFSTANPTPPLLVGGLPFAVPFAFQHEIASTTYPTLTPQPRPELMRPHQVVVRSVWASNLEQELELIEWLLPYFPYAAMDTEYPGTVHRSEAPVHALPGEIRYALMKSNVDELHLLQLGLTLFDCAGRLPVLDLGFGGGDVQCVWEFNFREFDPRHHRHAPESVAMLRTKGMDFERANREGVDMALFAPQLCRLMHGGLGAAGLITFSGAYDVSYLVKMVGLRSRLPDTALEFVMFLLSQVNKRFYDVKEMARRCPGGLHGGLELVAKKLGVPRVVGEAHQAGSDSLLTCHMFLKLKESYFDDEQKLASVVGQVTGITSC